MVEVVDFGVDLFLCRASLVHRTIDVMTSGPQETVFGRHGKTRHARDRQRSADDSLIAKGTRVAIVNNFIPARKRYANILVVMPDVAKARANVRHNAAER